MEIEAKDIGVIITTLSAVITGATTFLTIFVNDKINKSNIILLEKLEDKYVLKTDLDVRLKEFKLELVTRKAM